MSLFILANKLFQDVVDSRYKKDIQSIHSTHRESVALVTKRD